MITMIRSIVYIAWILTGAAVIYFEAFEYPHTADTALIYMCSFELTLVVLGIWIGEDSK